MKDKNLNSMQTFTIKRGLWDSKERKLIVTSDFISYEDGTVGDDSPMTIISTDIKDIRYGIARKNAIFFDFLIFIRNKSDQIMKIDFSSFVWKHGSALKYFHEISGAIWEKYSKKVIIELLDKIIEGEEIEMCDVKISLDKILIKKSGLFKAREKVIEWPDFGIKVYKSGFDVYSKQYPNEINRKFSYLEEWNAVLLLSLFKTLEKAKDRATK